MQTSSDGDSRRSRAGCRATTFRSCCRRTVFTSPARWWEANRLAPSSWRPQSGWWIIPPARSLLVLGFPDLFRAADAVVDALASGCEALEGLDDGLVGDCRRKGMHLESL